MRTSRTPASLLNECASELVEEILPQKTRHLGVPNGDEGARELHLDELVKRHSDGVQLALKRYKQFRENVPYQPSAHGIRREESPR